jgi:uncharacterized membrane protein
VTDYSQPKIKAVLYTRDGCKLCEQAHQDLDSLQDEIPHQLVIVDIGSDPALHQKFMEKIPVVEIGPYTLQAPFTAQDLQIALAAARDGRHLTVQHSKHRKNTAIQLNRLVLSFTRHWLAFFNFFILLYVGVPCLAPVLMKNGATTPAMLIYKIYSPMCHQLAYRSWFLFGEQWAYPLEATGLPGLSYEEITGQDPGDLDAGRDFIGNERFGYKVALCQRDVAIYGGILFAGLAFALLRKRLKPLPMLVWFLVGILPIGIDGGTQLLSVFTFLPFHARESTPLLRLVTGLLFGIMNIWLAYPYVEESMIESRALISAKLAGVQDPSA